MQHEEPLLTENPDRFVLFPIQYSEVWRFYKHIESKFWTAEDIELGEGNTYVHTHTYIHDTSE